MEISIENINLNYEVYGEDKEETLVILHGWGANLKTMESVARGLAKNFKVYNLDLPGFGDSGEPTKDFFVEDYERIVKEFLKKVKVDTCTLIGHSFGGRMITVLVGKLGYNAKKIIYVDAAGIKPKRSLSYYIKVYSYKLAKNVIKLIYSRERVEQIINDLRKKSGSDDYRNANDNMRKTFINVINEDLTHLFKNIKVPTLLIW